MAVEPDKHDLYQGLLEAFGQKRAETFMNLVTTVPWSEVATKFDLERFATKADFEERFATKADLERMGRRIVMWTASANLVIVGLALAAGRLI